MNYLVLNSENAVGKDYVYQGAAARDLIKQHDLIPGLNISAILFNQSKGMALIEEIKKDFVRVSYQKNDLIINKNPLTLLVGISRPQTVKKVIQLSLSLGVTEIVFILSANSEKSYLSSKIWEPLQLQHEISLGMAQSGDYLVPIIRIVTKLSEFLLDLKTNSKYLSATKYLATTKHSIDSNYQDVSAYKILAIGPEKGWTSEEEDQMLTSGFLSINFGARMLRVEQAIAYGAGKLLA